MRGRFHLLLVTLIGCVYTLPAQRVLAAQCGVYAEPVPSGAFSNPALAGVSGLAASRAHPDLWWIHTDRGSGTGQAGNLFAVRENGTLYGTWTLSGVADLENNGQGVVDTEDIAVGVGPGPGTYIYLADIGGNQNVPFGRPSVRIFRLREPVVNIAAGQPTKQTVAKYTTLTLTYPEGQRYDAETFMLDRNGDMYIVTKDSESGSSRVFRVPALPGDVTTATMTEVATLQFGAGNLAGNVAATAGDISASGTEAVIRTYNRAFVWRKAANRSWAQTFTQTAPCTLPQPSPQQYEAVAFDRLGISIYDTYETSDGSASIQRYRRASTRIEIPLVKR